jgi:hypothetical protein
MIDSTADNVHQALAKLHTPVLQWYSATRPQTTLFRDLEYSRLDISGVLLAKDGFTFPTTVLKVGVKFPLCLLIVLTINLGVPVSIGSD